MLQHLASLQMPCQTTSPRDMMIFLVSYPYTEDIAIVLLELAAGT
jgi:hypothetical protein